MTSPIATTSLPFSSLSYRPQTAANAFERTSFSQVAAQSRTTEVTLVTADGDVVSLSGSQNRMESTSFQTVATTGGVAEHSSHSTLALDAMTLQVQGDLSDEELADIQSLFADLTAIAGDFFNGDLEAAAAGALEVGATGSISSFAASFASTTSLATELSREVSGQMPAGTDLDLHQQLEDTVGQRYRELVKAQWREINDMLSHFLSDDGEEPKTATTKPQAADETPPAERFRDRLQETLARRPSLAPLAGLVAGKAIDRALDQRPDAAAGTDAQGRTSSRGNA